MNTIGAQYLMKNINYEFWDRVEADSELLYRDITQLNNQIKQTTPMYHELQIWCADMWAVLWGAWRLGYNTICHPNFDFSWGTSTQDDYYKMNIMHNAGVVNSMSGLFYKAEYINKLPYNENLDIKENTASWHYWNWIHSTSKKSILI
jgi:hypothetical protein